MKNKFLWFALLASAAMIAQAQAGGHHGGGGGFAGGFAAAWPAPSRSGNFSSFHPMSVRNLGGGRTIYSGQRFSSIALHSRRSMEFRPQYIHSNVAASMRAHQFTPGNSNRVDEVTRFANRGDRTITNPTRDGNGAGQVRRGDATLRADWRNRVFAQHSANWHRDWDRSRDHWWNGRRCHFFNGSWFIFDFGFDPWWSYWWSPYYYGYDYYPYSYGYDPAYDSGVYQGEAYYGQNSYADQYSDSTVAAAQERLAHEGYYRGQIDGVFGSEARAAIAEYQSNHGLSVTGSLTTDTLQALGLRRVASY